MRYSNRLIFILLLGLTCLLVYGNTINNKFAYDDSVVITENKIVHKGIAAIPEIFSTPYLHGYYSISNDLYRPLSLVLFAVEYQFFEQNPLPYHLINVLLFAGCVILLFLFLDRFFEQKKTLTAFIASFLFALHPIHTEVVANIKGCDELLCFLFAFAGLNIFLKYWQSGKQVQLILGSFCFLLSLLAKETAITFLAIVPLIFFFYRNGNRQRSILIMSGVVLVFMIGVAARMAVLHAYNADHRSDVAFFDNFLVGAPSLMVRLATAIDILGRYLKLLLIPYPLVSNYGIDSIPYVGFDNVWVLLSLAIYGALLLFAVRGLVKKSKDPFVFVVLFFLITIALFSNIFLLIGTPMAERLLFFPSVGFCLAAALLIEKWARRDGNNVLQTLKQPRILDVIIPVALIYGFLTISRNNDWTDNETLFSADIKKAPEDSRINNYLGQILLIQMKDEPDAARKKEMTEEAAEYFRKAIASYPQNTDADNNLGLAYKNLGRYDSAIVYFKKALGLTINKESVFLVAQCYYKLKQYDSSITYCRQALAVNPDNLEARLGLGNSYLRLQNYDSAAAYFADVVAVAPGNMDALNNLGIIYYTTKKYPEAINIFKKIIALQPNNIVVCSYLGDALLNVGEYQPAVAYLKKAYILYPAKFKRNAANIAAAYKKLGEIDSAKKYEAIARTDNPGFKL